MLWAGGKDSTASIAIAQEMDKDRLPFPVMFIDTTYKFTETYDFINKYAKEWKLDLLKVKNKKALDNGIDPWSAESPVLYDLMIGLKNKDGALVESLSSSVLISHEKI